MSTDYDLPEDVDFVLVRRDGELLDAIARRDRGYADLGELADDPALTLLAAFASDVDEGLVERLAELDAVADVDPVGADDVQPDPVRHIPLQPSRPIREVVPTSHRLPSGAVRIPGHAATRPSSAAPRRTEAPAAARRAHHVGRAGAAAAVVAAVLSVGGVAAAVTGNHPLSPVESVAHTVANVFGHGPSSHASDRAKLEASLHDVDALIRAGRLADAQALLAQLQTQSAGLSSQDRTGLQHQLAALQARLDRAVAASTKATAPGQTRAANPNRPTVKPSTGHSPAPVNSSGGNHTAVTPTSVPTLTPPPVPTPTVTKPTHGAAPTPPHKSGSAKQG